MTAVKSVFLHHFIMYVRSTNIHLNFNNTIRFHKMIMITFQFVLAVSIVYIRFVTLLS